MDNNSKQHYGNHTKFYTPHHFIFYPVLLLLMIIDAYCIYKYHHVRVVFGFIGVVLIMIGWLSFMLRQHYALGNQDRIVRLEMRLRYFILTQKRLEPLEEQLSFAQLAALRFASDAELDSLIKRAIAEKLSPKDIKKSIQHWTADDMRV